MVGYEQPEIVGIAAQKLSCGVTETKECQDQSGYLICVRYLELRRGWCGINLAILVQREYMLCCFNPRMWMVPGYARSKVFFFRFHLANDVIRIVALIPKMQRLHLRLERIRSGGAMLPAARDRGLGGARFTRATACGYALPNRRQGVQQDSLLFFGAFTKRFPKMPCVAHSSKYPFHLGRLGVSLAHICPEFVQPRRFRWRPLNANFPGIQR